MKTLPALLICAAALGYAGARADDANEQRARIAAERNEANAVYATRDAECRERFVVTPCLNEARRQNRDALDRLRRQQLLLDEAQRKQRAAQRIDAIRNKVAAEDAGKRQRPAPPPPAALRLRQPAASKPASSAHSPEAHADAAERARQARVRELREKQAEIQAHREDVARRTAQREASGKKPSAPLPVPPAAASALR